MTLTKLPATLKEAEALAFAREFIARLTEGNPYSEHSALSPEASRAFFVHIMKLMLQSVENRMRLVAAAKAGDPDVIDLLQSVLLDLKSRRIEMSLWPSEIIEYDMWKDKHGVRPRRRSEARDYPVRNICFALTVAAVVDRFGLPPTGRSARRRSACWIVAEALDTANNKRAYDTIATIWKKHGRHMPTVPGWAST